MSRGTLYPDVLFPQTQARAAKRQRVDTTDSEASTPSAVSSRSLKIAQLADKEELQNRGKTFLKSSDRVESWLDAHHGRKPQQNVASVSEKHLVESLAPGPSNLFLEEIEAGLLCREVADCSDSDLVMKEEAKSCSVSIPIHVNRIVDYDNENSVSTGVDLDSDHDRLYESMDRNISPLPLLPLPGPSQAKPDAVDNDADSESNFNLVQDRVPTVAEREIPPGNVLDPEDALFIDTLQERIDNEQDHLLGLNTNFDWTADFATFRGVSEEFTGGKTGPTRPLLTPYDAFSAIWDEAIISLIVKETNRTAQGIITTKIENGCYTEASRMRKWVDLTAEDIFKLFSVFMLMGLFPLGRLDMYWQAKGPVKIVGFREIMSFHRYVLLTRCLHFVDNSQKRGTDKKLFKLRPIIDHLNIKFQELYVMERMISLDESLSLWKGFLSWVQTIRTKSARFGIKTFELCEASTGYLWKFEVYTGKADGGSEVTLNEALSSKNCKIVLELLKGLEHKGYCVVMDNFYNCPALARYLKSQGFDCLGTVRANRKHMPDAIKTLKEPVPNGTIVSRHSGDVSVVSWKDAKLVNIISTYHDSSTYVGSRAGKAQVKPVSVRDYNKGMGGVDLKDQKLSMFLLERKRGSKWYIKMFKRFLNVSIHNAYIMHKSSLEANGQRPLTHRRFREVLVEDLLARFNHKISTPRKMSVPESRLRVDVQHLPVKPPKRMRCARCSALGKRREILVKCVVCEVGLCLDPCFVEYHTVKNLKSISKKV